jgi:hypothetical protein
MQKEASNQVIVLNPGKATHAPLEFGPKDCFPTYHFGYMPLLICGEQTPEIDLLKATGNVVYHREGEDEACNFAAKDSTSKTPVNEYCNNVDEKVKASSSQSGPVSDDSRSVSLSLFLPLQIADLLLIPVLLRLLIR